MTTLTNSPLSTLSDDEILNLITSTINGSDYDRGAVEEAQATANKNAVLMSRFLLALLKKNVITHTELHKLLINIFS